jgi:hypothetical protein
MDGKVGKGNALWVLPTITTKKMHIRIEIGFISVFYCVDA